MGPLGAAATYQTPRYYLQTTDPGLESAIIAVSARALYPSRTLFLFFEPTPPLIVLGFDEDTEAGFFWKNATVLVLARTLRVERAGAATTGTPMKVETAHIATAMFKAWRARVSERRVLVL